MDLALAGLALLFAGVPALLFLYNLRLYAAPPVYPGTQPEVSVLIPARDEAGSIGAAVASVLRNRGVLLEVLVYDDGSTDGTSQIVESIAASDRRVALIKGGALPEGWCGKQHACSVLARAAKYRMLCFMDADVHLNESALGRMAAFVEQHGVSLASGIPHQKTLTWLEQLLIPLIHFVLLGFLPIARMRRSTHPSYAAGCGQLFIADAVAYAKAGGHAAIRSTLHDGINLPRAFRRAGLKTDLFDATSIASCRMYKSAKEVWKGLGKNATEGLASPVRILPATLVLTLGQIAPWFLIATFDDWARIASAAALCLSYVPRIVSLRRFRQPWLSAILHPLGVLALLIIQWQAFFHFTLGRQAHWKGRSYRPVVGDPAR